MIGPVEHLHGVEDPNVQALLFQTLFDLERAARIRADDHLGPRLFNSIDLPVQELLSHIRFKKIVDPGAAAAEIRFGQLDELNPGDGLEDLSGLQPNLLPVGKVTEVLKMIEKTRPRSHCLQLIWH